MNNDDKILKALDNLQAGQDRLEKTVDQHGKILNQHGQVLTSLVQNVATVLQKQQEQGKDIKSNQRSCQVRGHESRSGQ